MKRTLLALITLLPLVVSACNTVEGAGTDIKKAGNGIEDSAADHKNY